MSKMKTGQNLLQQMRLAGRRTNKADELHLNILERVDEHISIASVRPSPFTQEFLDGKVSGSYNLDESITSILQRVGIPFSSSGGSALSPLSEITVPAGKRAAFCIPEKATHFAFAYPPYNMAPDLLEECAEELELPLRALSFLLVGGFLYFDAAQKIVQINAVSTLPSPSNIAFTKLSGAERVFPASALAEMYERGRLMPVTLQNLVNQGLRRFGWINPSEVRAKG